MVRVIRRGPYRVYVFRETGERHHLPHCHIFWPGGKSAVDISDLHVLEGDRLSRQAQELLSEFKDALRQAWSELNDEGS
jgi:hypothetical protein